MNLFCELQVQLICYGRHEWLYRNWLDTSIKLYKGASLKGPPKLRKPLNKKTIPTGPP